MHAQVADAQKASAVAAEKLSNLQHASKSCDVVDVNCDAIQGAHKKVIEAIEQVGSYPIVTLQHRSTTLSQISYHIR